MTTTPTDPAFSEPVCAICQDTVMSRPYVTVPYCQECNTHDSIVVHLRCWRQNAAQGNDKHLICSKRYAPGATSKRYDIPFEEYHSLDSFGVAQVDACECGYIPRGMTDAYMHINPHPKDQHRLSHAQTRVAARHAGRQCPLSVRGCALAGCSYSGNAADVSEHMLHCRSSSVNGRKAMNVRRRADGQAEDRARALVMHEIQIQADRQLAEELSTAM